MPLSATHEFLETLVEVFIALVGFSGVVIALGKSRIPEAAREFRIKALLFSSSVGLGGSLLPAVLREFMSNVWPVATIALGAFMTLNLVWALRRLVPMKKQGLAPPVTFWLVTCATVSFIVALGYSQIQPALLAPEAVYVAAVVWHVYLAMNHFARLILAVSW